MNIFKTDPCPIQSAIDASNKLVIKMPTESAQLLATAFPLSVLSQPDVPKNKDGTNRKHFNPKHGSARYTKNTRKNFEWVLNHGFALSREYHVRYKQEHFQLNFFNWVADNYTKYIYFENIDEEPVYLAMPDKYKVYPQDFMCYRSYIIHEKAYSRWPSVDKIPAWFPVKSSDFVDKNFVDGNYIKR